MKKYFLYNVKKVISVESLVTIEYLNIDNDFSYAPETHDFYEFVYVDNGEIACNIDDDFLILHRSDCDLIPPVSWHHYSAIKDKSAAIFILCFSSSSKALSLLHGLSKPDREQIGIISSLLSETKSAFEFPFDKKLKPLKNPLFGAQQIIEHDLEKLLIQLIRKRLNSNNAAIKIIMDSEKLDNIIVENILSFLKSNIYGNVTLDDISKTTFYSKAYINNIFKKIIGMPIKKYYVTLKIDEAKKLLKSNMSVLSVSIALGFDNANYFTKTFKRVTGKTPSQYKRSINK